jgi:ubiquinone/menaquinone biosynthesis C-methylase UbiE
MLGNNSADDVCPLFLFLRRIDMKENIYDNEQFFQEYSRFPRSVKGLSAAGEWLELKKMFPDFRGKRVLDLGCGFGWHCIYAAEQGAAHIVGIDISEKMLKVAKEKTIYPNIKYQKTAIEDIDFDSGSFDVVISSLAFHYIESFQDICNKVSRWLSVNGDFVFSVEHPIFTAHGIQDWVYDLEGNCQYWPVDKYFNEGMRTASFLGKEVVKYHKTLTTYIRDLLKIGFTITDLVEPQPAEHLLDSIPGMRDELRRPMMLIISAKKTEGAVEETILHEQKDSYEQG